MFRKILKRCLVFMLAATMVSGNSMLALAEGVGSNAATVQASTDQSASDTESTQGSTSGGTDASASFDATGSTDSTAAASDAQGEAGTAASSSGLTSVRGMVSTLAASAVTGGSTISSNGTYTISSGAAGTITVTAAQVTLIGAGTDAMYSGLSIDCTSAGTKITLQNVGINGPASGKNAINFTGTGNYLYLSGTNEIDQSTNTVGTAMIHVGADCGLTIDDSSDDSGTGSLYFYKSEQGAGIGGNSGEANGTITIAGGRIFGKGTKQGAVIGTGASVAGATAGDISVTGGEVYLIGNASGALIGGGGSSTAGATGGRVYVSGGTLTLNVNYSGPAIGGGGYSAASDATGGKLIVTGGSVRTYIDANAVFPNGGSDPSSSLWSGVTAFGVNDAAVTAEKVDGSGDAVALLKFDTSSLTGDSYTVSVDGKTFYTGGRHAYSYVNEALDKDHQVTVGTTQSNWASCSDPDLYFYLTKTNHKITVGNNTYYYYWNSSAGEFETCNIYASSTGKGTVDTSVHNASAGDTVSVNAVAADGYYTAQVRYAYQDNGSTVYKSVKADANGNYTFTMPEGTVEVYADFISIVWDGTVDISWYDPDQTEYDLKYGAQLAGLSALVNGIFNNYPLTADSSGNKIPYADADGHPNGYNTTMYNSFSASSSSSAKTTVVGDCTYLVAKSGTAASGTYNIVTTDTYWYGGQNMKDKTIKLTQDIDMGGVCSGNKLVRASWSGPNYMPIGGEYSMDPTNGYTKISASFNGTLDGQGHIVKNIYCSRHTSNYGDGASMGLIGRLGVHDQDSSTLYANPVVENVAVDGYIYGNRSIGGIIGKNGKSNGSEVKNCINFATVQNTDAKGCGGIAGAGWNKLTISNCVNFGYIYTSYTKNAGGLSGNAECLVKNSYNFGYVDGAGKDSGQALGTNTLQALFTNCYYLSGSSSSVNYPAVYDESDYTKDHSTITEITDASLFKTDTFLSELNANTRDWVLSSADTMVSSGVADALEGVHSLSSKLAAYDALGSAVPRTFIKDASTMVSVTDSGTPRTEYVSGQVFDPEDNYKLWANYSDGTKEEITDYKVTYQTAAGNIAVGDTKVTVSYEENGFSYEKEFAVTVTENEVVSVSVATKPTNLLYATGEYFDKTGMIVKATFSNGTVVEETDYDCSLSGALTASDTQVTVSYTYCGETVTSSPFSITVLGSDAPVVTADTDGKKTVQIENGDDLRWFANQVSTGLNTSLNAVVLNDIDLSSVTDWTPAGVVGSSIKNYYSGNFDGNGKDITLNIASGTAPGILFGGLASGGCIKNVILSGTDSLAGSAGMVGRANGGIIENCVNNAAITSSANYTGGIAGYVAGGVEIKDCENTGAVTSSGTFTGGIAGVITEAGSGISGCANSGSITGSSMVGGICGYLTVSTNYITGSKNAGAVTSTGSSATVTNGTGGIVGSTENGGTLDSDCNQAPVYSMGGSVGGIAGYISMDTGAVTNCYNTAAITMDNSSETVRAGGIAGTVGSNATAVRNCYDTGKVKITGSGTYAGSLIGWTYKGSGSVIKNNYALSGASSALVNNITAADTNAMTLTSAALKTKFKALGSAYAKDVSSVNAGYPVLTWQNTATDNTISLIEEIGTVTAGSKAAITAARTAYDALGSSEQAKVTNYSVLLAAESEYKKITQKVTATFRPNGGTYLSKSSVSVTAGAKLGSLPVSKRKGYVLSGWYTAKTGGNKISASTVCKNSTTYYAHWSKVSVGRGGIAATSAGSGQVTVKAKAVSNAKGYQVRYSLKSGMSSVKTKQGSSKSIKVSGLKKKTIYYLQARAYKLDSYGNKVYGSWSAKAKVRTK